MTTITQLPDPPTTADPLNFAFKADAFNAALPGFVDEINDFASNLNSLSTTSSSTSSVDIGTGTKNFTVEAGKSYFTGMSLRPAYDATNYMNGEVISYSGTSLSVNVTSFKGSGTYSAWVITAGQDSKISAEQLTPTIFNDLIAVTPVGGDYVPLADTSDGGNKKKTLISDILALATTLFASEAEYQTGTNTTKALNAAVARAQNIVRSSPVATTSGTSIDVTGIPAWIKRLTIAFSGVSTNGSSFPQVQIGDAGGIEPASYLSSSSIILGSVGSANFASGFAIGGSAGNWGVGRTFHGEMRLTKISDTKIICVGVFGGSEASYTLVTAGEKTLSDVFDRFRLTTVNGTDTFDAGSISYMWE